MTTSPLLQARDLHKAYNGKPALKGVSLSLAAGEMCALLGPNGAGKSTLLQLLTGLFSPDRARSRCSATTCKPGPRKPCAGWAWCSSKVRSTWICR